VTALGRIGSVAPLAAVGVAGFLLGSCGGGESALTTATGLTATRPAVTAPTRTEETATEPPRTVTTFETETTEPPVTVTTVETETTILPPRTTPATTATAAEPASSTDSSNWGWVALAIALVGAALIALVLWRRRHTQAAAWSRRLADLSRRSLLTLDDVVAEGSLVTGQVQALADEARSLESGAPDDRSKAATAALRVRLDELGSALEADRRLRLGSTPPSDEQLAYSRSLVRHQIERLQNVLRPADSGQRPA
jgi:hypothetical protein